MPAPSKSANDIYDDSQIIALWLSQSPGGSSSNAQVRRETIIGWLFVLPALLMYAVFVLVPLLLTIHVLVLIAGTVSVQ